MVTLIYRTLQQTLGYDTVMRCMRVMTAWQQLCVQNYG